MRVPVVNTGEPVTENTLGGNAKPTLITDPAPNDRSFHVWLGPSKNNSCWSVGLTELSIGKGVEVCIPFAARASESLGSVVLTASVIPYPARVLRTSAPDAPFKLMT